MNATERARKIELYGRAYDLLVEGLSRFPREMWHFRSEADPWTIHEIVVHIADSEANSFVRCRKLIAEPGSTVAAYDESGWARTLAYEGQSADDAIELFRWLRGNTYKLILGLADDVWEHTVYHPENGVMTMDDWLDVYAAHVPEHLAQATRIYEEWKQKSDGD